MYPNNQCNDCSPCPSPVTPLPLPNLYGQCGDHYDLSCIEYTGENIDCLGITSGMTITEILNIFQVAAQGCDCCVKLPQNCVLSDWGNWGQCICTTTDGVTTCHQTRTKSVITPSANGGTACGPSVETRDCTPEKVCFTFSSDIGESAPDGTQVLASASGYYNGKPYYEFDIYGHHQTFWYSIIDSKWHQSDVLGTPNSYDVTLDNGSNDYPISNTTTQLWHNPQDGVSLNIIQSTLASCSEYKVCFHLQLSISDRIYNFWNNISASNTPFDTFDHPVYTYQINVSGTVHTISILYYGTHWVVIDNILGNLGTLASTSIYPIGTWVPNSSTPNSFIVNSTLGGNCTQPSDVNCVTSLGDWSTCIGGTQSQVITIVTPSSGNGEPCPVNLINTRSCDTPNCFPPTNVSVVIIENNITILFTPITGPANYTVTFTSDGGTTYTTIYGTTSPIILVSSFLCGTTYSGWIVTNCRNGITSSQVPFTITIPDCPAPPNPCVTTSFLSGMAPSGIPTTSILPKINGDGFYDVSSPNSGVTLTNVGNGSGGNAIILSNILLSNGYLIGGRFTTVNGIARRGLAKLKCDNTVDTSFTYTTGATTYYQTPTTAGGEIYAIAVDNNLGRIYIGGNFSSYNGQFRNNFAVLDLNGTVLSSAVFNIGTGFTAGSVGSTINRADVMDIKIQSDGKILVCGYFTNYNGNSTHANLIRLNTNGTVDSTFNIGTGFTTTINKIDILTMELDSTGSIYIGGTFQKYQNITSNNLVKIKPNGNIDNIAFPIGTNINLGLAPGSGTIYKILIQGTRLLVGGSFTKYGSTVTSRFMKLILADATLDSFYFKNTDVYTNDNLSNIYDIVMSNSLSPSILIAGNLPSYSGNLTLKNYYVLDSVTGIINTTYSVTTPDSYLIRKIILK